MTWRKSTYSAQGECVEARGDLTALRDSKNPGGPALHTTGVPQLLRFLKVTNDLDATPNLQ
jgi:hypothetical protein